MLVSIAQTGLGKATTTLLMLDFGLLRNGTRPGCKQFDGPEIRNILKELTRELKDGPSGGFFMGKEPGRARLSRVGRVVAESLCQACLEESYWEGV